MPPKGWRKTAAGFQPTNSSGVNIKDKKVHGIEELLLPRSLIVKIAKDALPDKTPLPKDGVTALMRSATMFTSYITAEANYLARQDSRKTVTHADILKALETCHFSSFVNATTELSERVVIAPKKPSHPVSESAGDLKPADEDAEMDDDELNDDYIEEDIEPQADASIVGAGLNDTKRARLSTAEPSSDGDMQVDP